MDEGNLDFIAHVGTHTLICSAEVTVASVDTSACRLWSTEYCTDALKMQVPGIEEIALFFERD